MEISGSRSLTALRQPSSASNSGSNRLVFVYPFVIDQTLKKYANMLCDFLCVDIIGQIKTSNVLNITTSATQIGSIGRSNQNSAQYVRNSLWRNSGRFDMATGQDYGDVVAQQRSAQYQNQINRFLDFIQNQIKNDPRLQEYRPIISNITLEENFIDIPLIVGTKKYFIKSHGIYWLILGSLAFNLPMNSISNINNIVTNLEQINKDRYPQLLAKSDISSLTGNSRITSPQDVTNQMATQIQRNVQSEIRQLSNNFRYFLDLNAWQRQNGMMTRGAISLEDIPTIRSPQEQQFFRQSTVSLSGYVSNLIIPILHSLETLTGPSPSDLNYSQNVNQFGEYLVSGLEEVYNDLADSITHELSSISSNAAARQTAALHQLEQFRHLCTHFQENNDTYRDILNNLDLNGQIPPNFDSNSLINFMDTVTQSGNKLYTHTQNMNSVINEIMRDSNAFRSLSSQLHDRVTTGLNDLIYQRNEHDNNYLVAINYAGDGFQQRHANFFQLICGAPRQSDRCQNQFLQIMQQLTARIADIVYFLVIWNFFSYACDYLMDIDADIRIQQRDALEFPNYTLVIPIDLLRGIHTAHTSRNFRNAVTQSERNQSTTSLSADERILDNTYILSTNYNPERVIEMVASQLQVPNIIAVDEKKNEIVYQFMYMNQASKMKINTLQHYVNNQKNILPGF